MSAATHADIATARPLDHWWIRIPSSAGDRMPAVRPAAEAQPVAVARIRVGYSSAAYAKITGHAPRTPPASPIPPSTRPSSLRATPSTAAPTRAERERADEHRLPPDAVEQQRRGQRRHDHRARDQERHPVRVRKPLRGQHRGQERRPARCRRRSSPTTRPTAAASPGGTAGSTAPGDARPARRATACSCAGRSIRAPNRSHSWRARASASARRPCASRNRGDSGTSQGRSRRARAAARRPRTPGASPRPCAATPPSAATIQPKIQMICVHPMSAPRISRGANSPTMLPATGATPPNPIPATNISPTSHASPGTSAAPPIATALSADRRRVARAPAHPVGRVPHRDAADQLAGAVDRDDQSPPATASAPTPSGVPGARS